MSFPTPKYYWQFNDGQGTMARGTRVAPESVAPLDYKLRNQGEPAVWEDRAWTEDGLHIHGDSTKGAYKVELVGPEPALVGPWTVAVWVHVHNPQGRSTSLLHNGSSPGCCDLRVKQYARPSNGDYPVGMTVRGEADGVFLKPVGADEHPASAGARKFYLPPDGGHHLAVVCDGQNDYELYVDGTLVAAELSPELDVFRLPFKRLGGRAKRQSPLTVRELMVFDRALNVAEIQKVAAADRKLDYLVLADNGERILAPATADMNWGTVRDTDRRSFTIRNISDRALRVTRIAVSGDPHFSVHRAGPLPQTLARSQKLVFDVSCDPAGQGGKCTADIRIECDSPLTPEFKIRVQATCESRASEKPARIVDMDGEVEFGQTHVFAHEDSRRVPHLVGERETLVLFAPASRVDNLSVEVIVDGASQGILAMDTPEQLPPIQESMLTSVPLGRYRDDAWSTTLPWQWVKPGLMLSFFSNTRASDGAIVRALRRIEDIKVGAPVEFTLARVKLVVFGDGSKDTTTQDSRRMLRDFYACAPMARIAFVEYKVIELDYLVVPTDIGPVRMTAPEELEKLSFEPHYTRFNFMKYAVAVRTSLANRGHGLTEVNFIGGTSSKYASATYVSLGWFRNSTGKYVDLNDRGASGGWRGWSAVYNHVEDTRTYIHEVGHSFELSHFKDGRAKLLGVEDEYPLEGIHLPGHPWGYDTNRRQFLTTYIVGKDGPLPWDRDKNKYGPYRGKPEPMTYQHPPKNDATFYPPYTAYYVKRIQKFFETNPNLREDFLATGGAAKWDSDKRQYVAAPPPAGHLKAIAMGVPVITLIGSLGHEDKLDVCQIYPAMHANHGNVFEMPNPFEGHVDEAFSDAGYYLEIVYRDNTRDYALIAQPLITDSKRLSYFAVNLATSRVPIQANLYRAHAGHPAIDHGQSALLFTRDIEELNEPLPPVWFIGKEHGYIDDIDLVGHWKFESGSGNVARDATGGRNHGAIHGAGWAAGRSGGALAFDGASHVSFGNRPSMHGMGPFSIAAWIKTSASGVILQQRDRNGDDGSYQLRINENGTVGFTVYGDQALQFDFATSESVNDDEWHHVVAVRDGHDGYIYVDGNGDSPTHTSGRVRSLNAAITVAMGADIREQTDHFAGLIDELQLYRRALLPREVRNLFRSPLVGAWPFDEGEGSVVRDESLNGNHGTLHGATWVDARDGAGRVLEFTGAGHISFGSAPALDGLVSLSIAMWVRTTAAGVLLQQRGEDERDGHYQLRVNQDGTVGFMLSSGGASQFDFSTNESINDGNWHHIVAVRDGDDGYIFLDGNPSPAAHAAGTARPLDGTLAVSAGADVHANQDHFTGAMKGLRIYRTALDGEDIDIDILLPLLGHWPLDEGSGTIAWDTTRYGNHGTIHDATWVDDALGRYLSFKGQSKITFGTGPSLVGTAPFTLSAWVKTTASGVIWQQRNGHFNGQYQLRIKEDGTVYFMVYGKGGYQFQIKTTEAVNDGKWHHIVAIRSGDRGYIHIDGSRTPAVQSSSRPARPLNGKIAVGMGADIRDNKHYFVGLLDEMRLYGSALSGAHIEALYNDTMKKRHP